MIRYTHVEDYLEVIAGLKDPVTLATKHSNWFSVFEPIISLARYDVSVLESMSEAVNSGKALTERQGELAVKLVAKYQRQLAQKNIDTEPVLTPQWRYTLRKMDYSKKLGVVNDRIVLQFPFKNDLIDELRNFRKESQGAGYWDKDAKSWSYALTEFNLVWLTTWAETHGFEIDDEAKRLNQLIKDCEATHYAIELTFNETGCEITNCPEALSNYINEHLGGFELENLLKLVDSAAILGYTISSEIADLIVAGTDPRFYSLSSSREIKLNPTTSLDDFASVLDYADRTERWPVVIYEPDLSGRLLARLKMLRDQSDIAVIVPRHSMDTDCKYIHTTQAVTKPVALLVSSAGLIYGGDKSIMIQNAEKIVYTSAEVYNKTGQSKVKSL
jgi:hypothetical protein